MRWGGTAPAPARLHLLQDDLADHEPRRQLLRVLPAAAQPLQLPRPPVPLGLDPEPGPLHPRGQLRPQLGARPHPLHPAGRPLAPLGVDLDLSRPEPGLQEEPRLRREKLCRRACRHASCVPNEIPAFGDLSAMFLLAFAGVPVCKAGHVLRACVSSQAQIGIPTQRTRFCFRQTFLFLHAVCNRSAARLCASCCWSTARASLDPDSRFSASSSSPGRTIVLRWGGGEQPNPR